MRVLITGGSGFLGTGLVEKLLRDPEVERICIYSRGEHRQAEMMEQFSDPRLRPFIGDVRDVRRLERALHGVDTVIHAAALKRIEVGEYNPSEMFATNIGGSQNVLDAAERAGVERAVLVSSDKAFQPVSPYGISKSAAEALFRRHAGRMRTSIVRYGNVAGSTGSVIPKWRANPVVVRITDPACTRFWMFRHEAVQFVLSAARNMRGGELYVPDLPAFTIGDLASAMGIMAYERIGLPPHEKMHESMDYEHSSDRAPRLTVEQLREMLTHV